MAALSRRVLWAKLLGSLAPLLLTGCGFFVDPNTLNGGGGSGNSSNYLYVANPGSSTQSGTLNAYAIGTNSLTNNAGTYVLPSQLFSTSVAVTRSNSFVYVGGTTGIVGYAVGSAGVLTQLRSGALLSASSTTSLDTSPDGQWLFGLDGLTFTVDVYKINSDGSLAAGAPGIYGQATGSSVVPRQVLCSPRGNYVAAALGGGGFAVFPFNTSTGTLGLSPTQVTFTVPTLGDNGIAIDANEAFLYVSQSGILNNAAANGIYSYDLAKLVNGSTSAPVAALTVAGNAAGPLALNNAGTFLYVGNRADQTISGYSVLNGKLAALSGSPYAGKYPVGNSLVTDRTGAYLFEGTLGGVSDVSMYTFDPTTAGKLNLQASTPVATTSLSALAVTH